MRGRSRGAASRRPASPRRLNPHDAADLPSSVSMWRVLLKVPAIVDVAGPRADGQLVLSTQERALSPAPGRGRAAVRDRARRLHGRRRRAVHRARVRLARLGRRRVLVRAGRRVRARRRLDARGRPRAGRAVRRLASSTSRPAPSPPGSHSTATAVSATGCSSPRRETTARRPCTRSTASGHVSVIAQGAPLVEGGIVVAPPSFGRFGGRADRAPTRTAAASMPSAATARSNLVAESGLPAGGDIGVEALGFVPSRVGRGAAVYFSDLGSPGSPTQGDDSLLVLRGQDLARAALRGGELLAAMEGGGTTIAVRCDDELHGAAGSRGASRHPWRGPPHVRRRHGPRR